MSTKYTSIEEQVEYSTAKIDPDRKIEISLRDLMYVFQTLGEFNRFFHQPLHWQTLEDVQRFIGNKNSGAYHLLHECYYQKLRNIWPPDIEEGFGGGELEHPDPPYYYETRDDDV